MNGVSWWLAMIAAAMMIMIATSSRRRLTTVSVPSANARAMTRRSRRASRSDRTERRTTGSFRWLRGARVCELRTPYGNSGDGRSQRSAMPRTIRYRK